MTFIKLLIRFIVYTLLFFTLFTTLYIKYFYKEIPIIKHYIENHYNISNVTEVWKDGELILYIPDIHINNNKFLNNKIKINIFDILKYKELYIRDINIEKANIIQNKTEKNNIFTHLNVKKINISKLNINEQIIDLKARDLIVRKNYISFKYIINKYISGDYFSNKKESHALFSIVIKSKKDTQTILNILKNNEKYGKIKEFIKNISYGKVKLYLTKKNNISHLKIFGENISINKNKYFNNQEKNIYFKADYIDGKVKGDFNLKNNNINGTFTYNSNSEIIIDLKGETNFSFISNNLPYHKILKDIKGDFSFDGKIIFENNDLLININSNKNNFLLNAPLPIKIKNETNVLININDKENFTKINIKNDNNNIMIELTNKQINKIIINSDSFRKEEVILGGQYDTISVNDILQYFNIDEENNNNNNINTYVGINFKKIILPSIEAHNGIIQLSTLEKKLYLKSKHLIFSEKRGSLSNNTYIDFYNTFKIFKTQEFVFDKIKNINDLKISIVFEKRDKGILNLNGKLNIENIDLFFTGTIDKHGNLKLKGDYNVLKPNHLLTKSNILFDKKTKINGTIEITTKLNNLNLENILKQINGTIDINTSDLMFVGKKYEKETIQMANALNIENIFMKAIKNEKNGLYFGNKKFKINIKDGESLKYLKFKNDDIELKTKIYLNLYNNYYKSDIEIILPITKQGTILLAAGGLAPQVVGGYYIIEKIIGDKINKSLAKEIEIEGTIY